MKRETRILGLDCCNSNHVIGVVTRGGLYLDGVFAFERNPTTALMARKVTETKYFPELRAIMIHGSKNPLDASVVQRNTGLPVISISLDGRVHNQGHKRMSAGNHSPQVRAGMHASGLQEILSLTTIRGNLPEPVRIAHMLGRLRLPEIDYAR